MTNKLAKVTIEQAIAKASNVPQNRIKLPPLDAVVATRYVPTAEGAKVEQTTFRQALEAWIYES